MGCLKGKSEADRKSARYKCRKCGAYTDKKSHACKPKKNKAKEA